MQFKILITLMAAFFAYTASAAHHLECRSTDKVEGWTGSQTNDFLILKAHVESDTKLSNLELSGAYEAAGKSTTALKNYKPRSRSYKDYHKFRSLEDAWHWFAPLLPKKLTTQKKTFKGYVQISNEDGFLKTVGLKCLVAEERFVKTAKVVAKDGEGKTHSFALDKKGTPRLDGNLKTYPSIKEFREGGDWTDVCYVGAKDAVSDLLEALVTAADGDGDSWATLNAISFDSDKVATVEVTIEDESGENSEYYEFAVCK